MMADAGAESASQPPLPTFLILGAQKSATRWLRVNLGEHPDIFTAPHEISFFNQKYRRGTDFYRSQFAGWDNEPIVGEATPGYMMRRHRPETVANRIHETIPDVRLIALLRNPIDRANSALVHHAKRERVNKRAGLVDVVTAKSPEEDRLGIIAGGRYAASLDPFHRLFGDQLLVLLHDDVASDPSFVYRSALAHIGASTDFVPESLDRVVFSNQPARRKRTVSEEDRRRLWPFFEDDVHRLEVLIGRDLSSWNPFLADGLWPAVPDHRSEMFELGWTWVSDVLGRVTPEDYPRPTPCEPWTVGDLLVHMLTNSSLLSHGPLDGVTQEDVDSILAHPLVAFEYAREFSRLVVTSESIRRQAVPLPKGDVDDGGPYVSNEVLMFAQLVNLLTHTWDVAVSTGQDSTVPSPLAEEAEGFYRELCRVEPAFRAQIGPELPVDSGVDATTRLVALMGRDSVQWSNMGDGELRH